MPTGTPFHESIRRRAAELYVAGWKTDAIYAELGITPPVLYGELKKQQIQKRGYSRERKYALDKHFLSDITTDGQAWFLGYHAADGHCFSTATAGRLRFRVAERDKSILEKLQVLLKSNAPIRPFKGSQGVYRGRTIKGGPGFRIDFDSKILAGDATRHGFGGDKLLRAGPWNGPPHLMNAWWRGLLDGDGSYVCYRQKTQKSTYASIELAGTAAICEGFARFALEKCGVSTAVVRPRDSRIFSTRIAGIHNCQKIIRVLYDGATVWMDRKKEAADAILAVQFSLARSIRRTAARRLDASRKAVVR